MKRRPAGVGRAWSGGDRQDDDLAREGAVRALPGHVELPREFLFATLTKDDVSALAALLEPVLDHLRAGPPRSATPRRRRASAV